MSAGKIPFIKVMLGALLLAMSGGLVPSGASAQDLSLQLADAEGQVSKYEGNLSAAAQQLEAAEQSYRTASSRTAPYTRGVTRAESQLEDLQEDLSSREREADARIIRLQEQHRQEVDDHDREVREGVGFGLAALVAGLIAIAWGWFRAGDSVAALTRVELGQAIGVCIGSGLLLVIVGLVLGGSTGAVGALGSFLFCLGWILPTAFLLARHSAEVQRGRSRPLLRRERLPYWVPIATAGLMLVIFLVSTGSAIFADDASSEPVSSALREEAEAASQGRGAEELEETEEALAAAKQRAAAPLSRRAAAQRLLADSRQSLHSAQRQLASAEAGVRTTKARLSRLEAKEQREAEREEARLAREEQDRIEEEEEELASQCNPNYSGCLDPYSPDYDCAGGSGDGPDYTGTVQVIGVDEYELDDDNDGIGCDP